MSDKLGLGTEIRELKIGSSFFQNKTAFHTLRYDFKPASVQSTKQQASLEVGSNNQVTVTHDGVPKTVFKGSQKPYTKECVLIIDRNTGTFTLEKLSTNVLLKKTRQEAPKNAFNVAYTSSRPPTPIEKKSSQRKNAKNKKTKTSSSNNNALTTTTPSISASPQYPHRSPQIIHKSPPQVALSPYPAASSGLPSLDDVTNDNSVSNFDLGLPDLKASPDLSIINDEECDRAAEVGILTDSSDSSTDNSDSDSESEKEEVRAPKKSIPHKQMNGYVHMNKKNPSLPSVPHQLLNEDLQLSESGTDSD